MIKALLVLSLTIAGSGLFFSLGTDDARAKVTLKERITYYNVRGKNGRDIFKSMIDNGPTIGRRNKHALATTEFREEIKDIKFDVRNGRCIITSADIILRVKYTYPKWVNRRGASKATRDAWKHFNRTVIWHEKQHVKIAVDYMKEYEKALKKVRLRTSQNCSRASLGSRWRITSAALKHNRKQKQFDRRDLRRGGRGYEAQLRLLRAE